MDCQTSFPLIEFNGNITWHDHTKTTVLSDKREMVYHESLMCA